MAEIFTCRDCGAETENSHDITDPQNMKVILTVHRCDDCLKKLDRKLEWELQGESYQEDSVLCPYCGFEYDDYDTYGFDEGEQDVICDECGKSFTLEVQTMRKYSTHRRAEDMPEDFDPDICEEEY